jgi:hypothetical protein
VHALVHAILDRFAFQAVVRVPEVERRLALSQTLWHFSRATFCNRGSAVGKYQRSRQETRFIRGDEGEYIGHLDPVSKSVPLCSDQM